METSVKRRIFFDIQFPIAMQLFIDLEHCYSSSGPQCNNGMHHIREHHVPADEPIKLFKNYYLQLLTKPSRVNNKSYSFIFL